MGAFAETVFIDYRLLFIVIADLPKQMYFFHVHLLQTNGNLPFLFSVCSKQVEVAVFYISTENKAVHIFCGFKCKMEAQAISLIRLLFAHCANGSLLFVHLLTKNQMAVIRLQKD
jgi:hypothetical protein